MRHLKKFNEYKINEEFNNFDINRWMATAGGVFATVLNAFTLKWGKISKVWQNVSEYKSLMRVLSHISEYSNMDKLHEDELIDVIKNNDKIREKDIPVKYSKILTGPSQTDLLNYFLIYSYDGNLENDIDESISFINELPTEKKVKLNLKDVEDLLSTFKNIVSLYERGESEKYIDQL